MASYVFDYFKRDVMGMETEFYDSNGYYTIELVNAVPFDTSAISVANNHRSWPDVKSEWSIEYDDNFKSIGYSSKDITGSDALQGPDYTAYPNIFSWSADDVIWESVTIDARGAVITQWGAFLMFAIDFGKTISITNGDFRILWPGGKIFNFT